MIILPKGNGKKHKQGHQEKRIPHPDHAGSNYYNGDKNTYTVYNLNGPCRANTILQKSIQHSSRIHGKYRQQVQSSQAEIDKLQLKKKTTGIANTYILGFIPICFIGLKKKC